MSLQSVYVSQPVSVFKLLVTGVEWEESVIDIVGSLPVYFLPFWPRRCSRRHLSTLLPFPPAARLTLLQNALALLKFVICSALKVRFRNLAYCVTLDDLLAE